MTASGATIYSTNPDWRNTPHIIQDSTKTLAWEWQPDPFGKTAPSAPSLTYNFRYPGQFTDSESSTNWNNARIYSYNTGRYNQSDPLGLYAASSGTYSTYPYVGSNPLTGTDPKGRQSEVCQVTGDCPLPSDNPPPECYVPTGSPAPPTCSSFNLPNQNGLLRYKIMQWWNSMSPAERCTKECSAGVSLFGCPISELTGTGGTALNHLPGLPNGPFSIPFGPEYFCEKIIDQLCATGCNAVCSQDKPYVNPLDGAPFNK